MIPEWQVNLSGRRKEEYIYKSQTDELKRMEKEWRNKIRERRCREEEK
jgi:hypothetical protein